MDESLRQAVTRNILEAMPLGLMVVGHDGEIVVVNPALTVILGYSMEQLTSSSWGGLFFSRDENREFNDALMEVISFELVNFHRRVPYINPRTNSQMMLSLVSSFLREGEERTGVVLLVEDITETHQQLQRERRLLWERNILQRERAEGLKKLALSVAHQVRNPLMSIAGFTGRLLKSEQLSDSAREKLEIIMEESGKLEKTVQTVADYASLAPPEKERLEVRELIGDIRRTAQERYGLSPEVQSDDALLAASIAGDRAQIVRAIMHIVDNAVEAGADTLKMSVSDTTEGDIFINISDNGPGIGHDELPYIFDPFYTTKPHAVGMGLTEARHIVLDNQGEIIAESPPGEGATFHLNFPTAPAHM